MKEYNLTVPEQEFTLTLEDDADPAFEFEMYIRTTCDIDFDYAEVKEEPPVNIIPGIPQNGVIDNN